MSNISEFEKEIIDNTIGYGEATFAFNFDNKKEQKCNYFLFAYSKENDTLDIISLNIRAINSIKDFKYILERKNAKEILKNEINDAINNLVETYIYNYSFSKENNIPLNCLNHIYSKNLYRHFKRLKKLKMEEELKEELKEELYEKYNLIEELFKFLKELIDKIIPNRFEEVLA